jgi:16S rRNA A1518/A1519 N6-dimethyltransferase RsmA/KsgA/DIM1 with predicted DNA glycosylase/AP lyase activity
VALFGARRKQLHRALRTVFGLDAEASTAGLEAVGLDGERRPETLTVAEFEALYRQLVDGGKGNRLVL